MAVEKNERCAECVESKTANGSAEIVAAATRQPVMQTASPWCQIQDGAVMASIVFKAGFLIHASHGIILDALFRNRCFPPTLAAPA